MVYDVLLFFNFKFSPVCRQALITNILLMISGVSTRYGASVRIEYPSVQARSLGYIYQPHTLVAHEI